MRRFYCIQVADLLRCGCSGVPYTVIRFVSIQASDSSVYGHPDRITADDDLESNSTPCHHLLAVHIVDNYHQQGLTCGYYLVST